MDKATVGIYDNHAREWLERRPWHPRVPVVQADVAALPFRRGALGAAWANCCYQHLRSVDLPMALADLHRALDVGAPVAVTVHEGDGEGHRPGSAFPGRYFSQWSPERLTDLLVGAGFRAIGLELVGFALHATAERAQSLPDTVGPDMRLLVCGLNPSIYAADAGAAYARPSNRFWPAAIAAGLVERPRDPVHAFRHHRIGMTDLAKRATARSAELSRSEYEAGAARLRRLVEWLGPEAVCFVGLEGYRIALDRRATPGWQPEGFAGRPAYLLPSTSGLNAHVRLADIVAHLSNLRQ